jgi:integrase
VPGERRVGDREDGVQRRPTARITAPAGTIPARVTSGNTVQAPCGAGLSVIKLHEGRHSAASLARDAAVDPEIRRRTLGHADAAMTAHYTHIEAEAHKAAAEAVAKLVEGAAS